MIHPVNGIQLKDQKSVLKIYPQCFTGRDAVDWITKNCQMPREEAVKIGNALMARNVIYHVAYEHDFQDSYLFYKFREGNFPSERSNSHSDDSAAESVQEGWLEKQGDWIKSWKLRFFVLRKGGIQYYKRSIDQKEDRAKGIISLIGAIAEPAKSSYYWAEKEKDSDCFFTIKTPGRDWVLKAKTRTDRDNWIKSINQSSIHVKNI